MLSLKLHGREAARARGGLRVPAASSVWGPMTRREGQPSRSKPGKDQRPATTGQRRLPIKTSRRKKLSRGRWRRSRSSGGRTRPVRGPSSSREFSHQRPRRREGTDSRPPRQLPLRVEVSERAACLRTSLRGFDERPRTPLDQSNLRPLRVEDHYQFRPGQEVTVIGTPGSTQWSLDRKRHQQGGDEQQDRGPREDVLSVERFHQSGEFGRSGPQSEGVGRRHRNRRSAKSREALAMCIPSEDLERAVKAAKARPAGERQQVLAIHTTRDLLLDLDDLGGLSPRQRLHREPCRSCPQWARFEVRQLGRAEVPRRKVGSFGRLRESLLR